MTTKTKDCQKSNAASKKTPEPLLPAISKAIRSNKPTDEIIHRLYNSGDREGLFNVFFRLVGDLTDYRLRARDLFDRASDLRPELIAEGLCELWAATGRILGRQMDASHIRNSLRLAIEARLDRFLDELPVAGASAATLKARRWREKDGGDHKRPEIDRRPADMPEIADDGIPWSGYYSFEWYSYLFDGKRFGVRKAEAKFCGDAATEVCRQYLEYKLFVGAVRKLALELSAGDTHKAVRFFLHQDWNDQKRKWRLRKMFTIARHVDVPRKTLRSGLDLLAQKIAASFGPVLLDFAKIYLTRSWPHILDFAAPTYTGSDGLVIEKLSKNFKSKLGANLERAAIGPIEAAALLASWGVKPGGLPMSILEKKPTRAERRAKSVVLTIGTIDSRQAYSELAADAAEVQARIDQRSPYVEYHDDDHIEELEILDATHSKLRIHPANVVSAPHYSLVVRTDAIPA